MTEEILSLIATQLTRIADAKAPANPLGFGPAPKKQIHLFCNRKNGGIWYTLDDQSNPVNVDHPALTGYIRKIEAVEATRRNEKSWKLHCTVEADRLYKTESSVTAHFSKGLLSAIAQVEPSALKEPLTIVPQASTENGEVLFCDVYQGDRQVFAPYDGGTDFKRVLATAIKNVEVANDVQATPVPQEAPCPRAWGAIKEWVGFSPEQIRNIAIGLEFPPKASDLSIEQSNTLFRHVLAHWAFSQKVFQTLPHAIDAASQMAASLKVNSDREFWDAWSFECSERARRSAEPVPSLE